MDETKIITLLQESFRQFIKAAHPQACLKAHVPAPPNGRTIILGAGKAAAAMAKEWEDLYPGPLEGLVVTRYGHKVPTRKIRVIEAGHPVPDDAGAKAVKEIERLASDARPEDLVVCLLSGGGSSLLSAPVAGVSLSTVQQLTKALLASGAAIDEINCVRKHLNRLLGGGLAALVKRSSLLTLAISDVVGDDPSTISSGPTVGDPTYLEDAIAILKHYDIALTQEVSNALTNPLNETPKPEDPLFDRHEYRIIAAPLAAFSAASDYWANQKIEPLLLTAELTGQTNEAAQAHIAEIRQLIADKGKLSQPLAILSGGETTVKLEGTGEGGPNTQFALAAVIALDKHSSIYGLTGDSDGYDGSGDNAGAYITPNTVTKGEHLGLDAKAYLANNDSYNYFRALNQLVITGATNTNINDYRVFLVMPQQ